MVCYVGFNKRLVWRSYMARRGARKHGFAYVLNRDGTQRGFNVYGKYYFGIVAKLLLIQDLIKIEIDRYY